MLVVAGCASNTAQSSGADDLDEREDPGSGETSIDEWEIDLADLEAQASVANVDGADAIVASVRSLDNSPVDQPTLTFELSEDGGFAGLPQDCVASSERLVVCESSLPLEVITSSSLPTDPFEVELLPTLADGVSSASVTVTATSRGYPVDNDPSPDNNIINLTFEADVAVQATDTSATEGGSDDGISEEEILASELAT